MTVVDAGRLMRQLKNSIILSVGSFISKPSIIFHHRDDAVGTLMYRLADIVQLPYRSIWIGTTPPSFLNDPSLRDRPIERISIGMNDSFPMGKDTKYLHPALLDSLAEDSLILDGRIKNDTFTPNKSYWNHSSSPFAQLFMSEVVELVGQDPLKMSDDTLLEERILREDDRCGIISGGLDPTKHPEWFRYSGDEKKLLAKLYGRFTLAKKPSQFVDIRFKKDLVR
jgi:hypothetical protein